MSDFKVYTKTGDKGETALLGGDRVAKFNERIDLYGDVDHLNSHIGLAISFLTDKSKGVENELKSIQNILFDIGSNLACPTDKRETFQLAKLSEEKIKILEESIDKMESTLPTLKNFILPGGGKAASFLHIARTTCRMVERKIVHFAKNNPGDLEDEYIQYFNRLSDYLFVVSRYCNKLEGEEEILWSNS
jgi:cob(I)alamin adenosyltransferase